MTPRLYITLILLALSALAHTALIQPTTVPPLRLYSIDQFNNIACSFNIYIPTTISSKAYLEVDFPLSYYLPPDCRAYIKAPSSPFVKFLCEKASDSRYVL